MTSLIDVIFLLLLFFMLSSTFTRFAQIELRSGGAGGEVADLETVFLQLGSDTITLDGTPVTLDSLPRLLRARAVDARLIVSLSDTTSSQRLSDLLIALSTLPDLPVVILGAG